MLNILRNCLQCFVTASKKIEWWGAGVVICLEQSVNYPHMAHLMPLPPIISCFIKIQNGSAFLVPGCPGKRRLNGCISSKYTQKYLNVYRSTSVIYYHVKCWTNWFRL